MEQVDMTKLKTFSEKKFYPWCAELDIWMHVNRELYEYNAVYVDALAFAMKQSEEFVEHLRKVYDFKA